MNRLIIALLVAAFLDVANAAFESAAPVWPEGQSAASNVFVRFAAKFDYDGGECPLLRLTASTVYRANLNGRIVGYGPARAVKGVFRVDEWPLRDVRVGQNELTVEVAGYCLDTFQYAPQHSFLQAEVVAGGRTVLATPAGWTATRIARAREGDPYSMQRGFPHESYVMMGSQAKAEEFTLGVTPPVRYLPREVPYPEFKVNSTFEPCAAKGRGQVYAAKGVDTGFAGVKAKVSKPGKVVLEFEERLTNGALDPFRTGYPTNLWHFVVNRVEWDVRTPGEYVLETFEPYTFKYATAYFDGGEGELSAPYLIQYRNPLPERARYTGADPELRAIFDAATSTLAQNAVDIFTDCPSRERSGWLCDSWFSSQAMAALTGDRSVERTMLEGMAGDLASASGPVKSPMTGGFPKASDCMPTYMMWYVIQCAEYAEHAGADAARFKGRVRNRVLSNFLFFRDYLNADGLLEDLPGWVFIEWSHANDLTKGVNYPANMMYAKALDAAARMYGLPEYAKEAAAVRAKIREQAFDGTWFHDQAVRRNGKLELVRDCTEICQYYAFFTDTATRGHDAELARRVVEAFRPGRELPQGLFPADMFIGYMLRLRVLKDLGREDLIPDEIKARVGHQVRETGSLWEFSDGHDSCCHGFVSYVATFLPFVRQDPVKVIFETDMCTDFDDAGALACLHAMADAGECEILATVANTRDCLSVAMCEIVNSYYGRPDIPVGCARDFGVGPKEMDVHRKIFASTVEKYGKWVKHANSSDAPEAVEVYRKVLSAQPDKSVTICSVGFLTNLRKLLETDRELVERKVKRLVAMACFYPKGFECNALMDSESSKVVLEKWPTPIVFTDFQYGMDCFAGRALAESAVEGNPVADVFRGNIPSREEIRKDAGRHLQTCNGMGGRSAWDETAVLIAVRGIDRYFNVHRGTFRMIGDKGENEWIPDEENGPHLRVTEKVNKLDVGKIIDELMCRRLKK